MVKMSSSVFIYSRTFNGQPNFRLRLFLIVINLLFKKEVVKQAIDSAMAARKEWEKTPHEHR